MSSFFSPLEEEDVRRTSQDEDQECLAAAALAVVGDRQRVFPFWRPDVKTAIEGGTFTCDALLVAGTKWACDLVWDTVEASNTQLTTLGTITCSGVTAHGVGLSGSQKSDPISALFALDDTRKTLVLTIAHDVPHHLSREYAAVVCAQLGPKKIAIITSMDENASGAGTGGDDEAFVLYMRSGSLETAGELDETSRLTSTLPSGVLLDGVAAAIATRREMQQKHCTVVAVPTPQGGPSAKFGSTGSGSGFGPGFGGGVSQRVAYVFPISSALTVPTDYGDC
jgi:hypothetical protein